MLTRVDPVTLEVMRNALQSTAEEMGATLTRTALSPNIKDRRDCSSAIYSPRGELVAQAEHIPLHLGLMPTVVKTVLERFPAHRLEPGDALVINDPYVSGSHLPDVSIIVPVFVEDRLVAIAANLAHHVDMGGVAPGSMPVNASEIFQEGIRIPPVKIRKRGRLDEEICTILTANVRTPVEMLGDLQAQIAGCNVGERRIKELAARYGVDGLLDAMGEILSYSERRMRAALAELPNAAVTFEDYLEGDGYTTDEPIPIRVRLEKNGSDLLVDFTGTSPQIGGSMNCTRAVTLACVYYAVKAVADPSAPANEGTFRPITTVTPRGSLVNPIFPAATSNANINTSQRIADVVLGALGQVVPERVPAASSGTMNLFTLGGVDPRSGEYYSYVETYGGGQGALWNQDGMDGVHTNMTNTRNTPTEVIEIAYPLLVERYALLPDTGGPGQHRGGTGLTREITVLGHTARITLGTERKRLRPWGLAGGGDGGPSRCFVVSADGTVEDLPSKVTRTVAAGSTVGLRSAGGGGYGDPRRRDRQAVARDIREGLVSAEVARAVYGE
ncbi:MAG: hydantoinase B/oxoprolinase family protein [Chloroflexi bacterium]|nr:hydantoinase B/oxoprolinase family protein [Chloroflexota bacterium]